MAIRQYKLGPAAAAGDRYLSVTSWSLLSASCTLLVWHICNLSTWEKEAAGSALRVILGYIGFKASLVYIGLLQ